MCVCESLKERERERKIEKEKERKTCGEYIVGEDLSESVCVCERDGERECL